MLILISFLVNNTRGLLSSVGLQSRVPQSLQTAALAFYASEIVKI